MTNYIALLSPEETDELIGCFDGESIRKYFQKNPKEFSKIRPGFRPNGITKDEAKKVVRQNIGRPFVSSWVNTNTEKLLSEITEHQAGLLDQGVSEQEAWLCTLHGCVFREHIALYFKLAQKEVTDEEVLSCQNVLDAMTAACAEITAENEKALPPKPVATVPEEELRNKEKEWNNKVKDLESELEGQKKELEKCRDDYAALLLNRQAEAEELENLRKRANAARREDKIHHNEDYPYCSLCQIIEDYSGRLRLERISDIDEASITGEYRREFPEYQWLFLKDVSAPVGSMGVWDWRTVPNEKDAQKDFIETVYNNDLSPVEVIVLPDCQNKRELLQRLADGTEDDPCCREVLYSFWNGAVAQYEGVLCSRSQFDEADGKLMLKPQVTALPCYCFHRSATVMAKGKYFYRSCRLGLPAGILKVKEDMELVKEAVLRHATWPVFKQKGLQHDQQRMVKEFLTQLPAEELRREIADACDCSEAEADKLLQEFIDRAQQYMSAQDVDTDTLAKVVRNNAELLDKCSELIYEEWKKENEKILAEAQKKLSEAEDRHGSIESENRRLEERNRTIREDYDKMRRELDRRTQLSQDVEKKVSERIERARKDAAEFMAEQMFRVSEVKSEGGPAAGKAFWEEGTALPQDELEINGSWRDTLETLSLELAQAGVTEVYANPLAALLYAAYLNRVNLLLAGPNAVEIADAFSASLTGQTAARIDCPNITDGVNWASLAELQSEVVVMEQPFNKGWNPCLRRLKNKFVLAVNPYMEDLRIEPRELSNYFVPLMTELFVDGPAAGGFLGGCRQEPYKEYKREQLKPVDRSIAEALRMSPLTASGYQKLFSDMAGIDRENATTMEALCLLSFAYMTDSLKALEKVTADFAVPKSIFAVLQRYIGEAE